MSERSTKESQILEEVTGKRFCLDHQRYVDATSGSMISAGGRNRWVCFNCQSKREAFLKSRKK